MAEPEPKPEPEKKKYGIFPPFEHVENGKRIGHRIRAGYSMEEWEKNWPKAMEEVIANFTPEELAQYKKNVEEGKRKEAMAKNKKKKKS